MTYPLARRAGFVVANVRVEGPLGQTLGVFAVDTGATRTLISLPMLSRAGFNLARREIEIVTATGTDTAAMVELSRIDALGRTRRSLPVLGAVIPAQTRVDGLLGLDFLGAGRLVLDFGRNLIRLEE